MAAGRRALSTAAAGARPPAGSLGQRTASEALRVALLPWATALEDVRDRLTLDELCNGEGGAWPSAEVGALRRAGHEPAVVVTSRTVRGERVRLHEPTGTPVTVLPAPRATTAPERPYGVRADLAAYRRALPPGLLGVLRRHDAVLLRGHEQPAADLLAWWGRAVGLPVVAWSGEAGSPTHAERPAGPLQRVLRGPSVRRLSGLLLGPAQPAGTDLDTHRADPARVARVPPTVDSDAWRPRDRAAARRALGLAPGAFVVAWHGRVDVTGAGLDLLLAAWADLVTARPEADVRLLLDGTGPDGAALPLLLADPRLRGVTAPAPCAVRGRAARHLAACDLWAGPGQVATDEPLQAMASARPVLLADTPGARELLGQDCGAALVRHGDAGALAVALVAALDRRPELELRGRAARRHARLEHSPDRAGAALALAVEDAVARTPRRRPAC